MSIAFARRELARTKPIDPQMDQWCFPSKAIALIRSPPHVDLGIMHSDEKLEVRGGEKTLEGRSLYLIKVSGNALGLINRDDHPFGSP